MKTIVSFVAVVATMACGLQEVQVTPLPETDTASDAGTTSDPDAGTVTPDDAGTVTPIVTDAGTTSDPDAGTVTPDDAGTVTPIVTDAGTPTATPWIKILSPADGFETESSKVDIVVEARAAVGPVRVNLAFCMPKIANQYVCSIVLPLAGVSTLTAVATDQAGNIGTYAVKVTRFLHAPFSSSGTCKMRFANEYCSGCLSGGLRGNLPFTTWTSGPAIAVTTDADYLDFSTSAIAVGDYRVTWVDAQGAWALYGSEDFIRSMRPEARKFLACNWIDETTGAKVYSFPEGQRSCNVAIRVMAGCIIQPLGWADKLQ